VQLSPAHASALEGLRARRATAMLPLRVTVADAVGNRTPAGVAVALTR